MPLPPLAPAEIELIQTSFATLAPAGERVATEFYRRLFELDPALRGLFHGDMRAQGRKLIDMLAFIARGLPQPEILLPAVRALGERHVNYRVKDEHYATVGRALLDTLAAQLGAAATPAVRDAWAHALGVLSEVMIAAAAEARARGRGAATTAAG